MNRIVHTVPPTVQAQRSRRCVAIVGVGVAMLEVLVKLTRVCVRESEREQCMPQQNCNSCCGNSHSPWQSRACVSLRLQSRTHICKRAAGPPVVERWICVEKATPAACMQMARTCRLPPSRPRLGHQSAVSLCTHTLHTHTTLTLRTRMCTCVVHIPL